MLVGEKRLSRILVGRPFFTESGRGNHEPSHRNGHEQRRPGSNRPPPSAIGSSRGTPSIGKEQGSKNAPPMQSVSKQTLFLPRINFYALPPKPETCGLPLSPFLSPSPHIHFPWPSPINFAFLVLSLFHPCFYPSLPLTGSCYQT